MTGKEALDKAVENQTAQQINVYTTSASSMLLVLFIGLKLGHVIDWDWGWVLAPLWIPFALVAAIVCAYLLVVGAIGLVVRAKDWRR